jgi:hypothetical protein
MAARAGWKLGDWSRFRLATLPWPKGLDGKDSCPPRTLMPMFVKQ